jgi:hypothetical protein
MPLDKYKNYCDFLADHFDVISSKDDFRTSKNITFRCKIAGHDNTLKATTFGNKKAAQPDASQWCEVCKKSALEEKDRLEFSEEVKHLGHEILSVKSGKDVVYRCGNCGRENTTTKQNFRKSKRTEFCSHCQNAPRRIAYTELVRVVEAQGMKLLTTAEEYTNNKQKLRLVCICGNDQHEAVLFDIRRGKHCKENCKTRKFEATCTDKYGVRNVSQDLEIQERMAKRRRTAKEYALPSGRKITVEGFENLALDRLLHSYEENDLLIGAQDQIPRIWYDIDGKKYSYTPDICITSERTLVEVKFLHFYDDQKEKNVLKFNAVLQHGYALKLLFFDKKERMKEFNFKPGETFTDSVIAEARSGLLWH